MARKSTSITASHAPARERGAPREPATADLDAAYAESARLRTQSPELVRVAAAVLRGRSEAAGYARGVARALLLNAWADLADEHLAESRAGAESAFAALERAGDASGAASALNVMATVARREGDAVRAASLYADALERAQREADVREWTVAKRGLAACAMVAGDLQLALETLEQAEHAARRAGETEEWCSALLQMGAIVARRGQYADAARHFGTALEQSRMLGHRRIQAQALGNLATVQAMQGRLRDAVRSDLEALAMHRELNDRRSAADRLANLGTRYQAIGDYARAHAALTQADEMYTDLGDESSRAVVLSNLGALHLALGNHGEAAHVLHRSLALGAAARNRFNEAYAGMVLGKVRQDQGDARAALVHYLGSLRLSESFGDPRAESEACLAIGSLYAGLGEYTEAATFVEHALRLVRGIGLRAEESQVLIVDAGIHAACGDVAGAVTMLEGALATMREFDAPRYTHEVLAALIEIGRDVLAPARLRALQREADELTRRIFAEGTDRHTLAASIQDMAIEREARRVGLGTDDLARVATLPGTVPSPSVAAGLALSAHADADAHAVPPAAGIRVRMLGGFAVERAGSPLADADWGRKRSRELFKLLLLRCRTWVPVDELFDVLWGEHTGQQIEMVVMKAVSNLRKALGGARGEHGITIAHDNGAYCLELADDAWVDIHAFRQAVVAARRAQSAGDRHRHYATAMALYAGELLPQDRYAVWTEFERSVLREAYVEAGEFVAREHLRLARLQDAVDVAHAIAAADPLNEVACQVRVDALRAFGRHGEAQHVYDEYCAAFHLETGDRPTLRFHPQSAA